MQLLTTSTANRNLASGATVLSATPDASNPRVCQALIYLGDGTNNLTSTGGAFSVTITIGGQTWMGGARSYVLGTAVRACLVTDQFPVPAGALVTIAITSPNSGDSVVGCTTYLMSEEPVSAVVSAVLAGGDVDGFTVENTLKLLLAALAGKVSGAGTTTVTLKAADDSKARITATVDTVGNRTALTLDATG